ncbi:haloalkane dehalogenase [Roseateles sp. DAIF2]|uniref:haloalkane dehalogenase n=1 Tax=Roseateles sp. DAIF2 TaxID=2714952 RepID=UPI0018A300DA|nr:haloalkane dehalogenase [Roseateles sp. DAIF2]QPF73811.1 haloalkane dehalogenase [Roseateles sp. DAIF2]
MQASTPPISALDALPRRQVEIEGRPQSYVDIGEGRPIVFLHGNPTSSYLWRNIIPHLQGLGRCLAPDLPGFGASPLPAEAGCGFADQLRYLDAWFERLDLQQDLTLVLHDWGSALGFAWARRHPERVRAIAYMEALVQPRRWADFPNGRDQIFRALRSERGEAMILDDNFFVETVLPKSVLRPLAEAEMAAYRRPFAERASRRVILALARELPIEGTPADVAAEVEAYGAWLAASPLPKLLISARPGALLTGRALDFCRGWPNQREVEVAGVHYLQEDAPHEIGAALREFVAGLPD